MKKALFVVAGAITSIVVSALPALAQYDVGGSNGSAETLRDVAVRTPNDAGFFGGLSFWLLLALALALAVAALLMPRLRRATV
jgi:hypothetical protein